MKKVLSILLILIFMPMLFSGCSNSETEDTDDKLKVAVSINVLAEFTEAIGGDKVDVYTVVDSNIDPHDFDFTPAAQKELASRELLIYNGLGLEEWIDQIESNVNLVDCSDGVDVIETDGVDDPHIWLSTKEAIIECTNIKDALVEADPDNAEYYEANYETYTNQLQELYDEYSGMFTEFQGKSFVTSHEAFAYLCRDFGLEQKAIKGVLNEDVESTFKGMEELANFCTEEGITVVFSENSESQEEAETLAKAIGGEVVPIYTLETKVEGKTYIEVMKENYEIIYNALKGIS